MLARMSADGGHTVCFYRNSFGENDDMPFALEDRIVKIKNSISPLHIANIGGMIRRHDIDIVHANLSKASVLGGISAGLFGVPSVASVHGMNSFRDYRFVDHMLAVSEDVKKGLIHSGARADRVTVIYHGVSEWTGQPRRAGEDGVLKMIYAGRLSREKGVDILLQALSSIPDISWRLTVAGTGAEKDDLKRLAVKLGIADRVVFAGFMEDVRSEISASDLLIQPSRKEGFGLSVIEAFSAGVPAIASRTGGLAEIVDDGRNGFLFTPEDPAALAGCIKRASDPSIRGRMAEEAYSDYRSRFSLNTMYERTIEAYEKTIRDFNRNT